MNSIDENIWTGMSANVQKLKSICDSSTDIQKQLSLPHGNITLHCVSKDSDFKAGEEIPTNTPLYKLEDNRLVVVVEQSDNLVYSESYEFISV